MKGAGPICLKVDQHTYYEHSTVAAAKAEAERLATRLGSDVVVYVPVFRVSPPRGVERTNVPLPADAQRELDLRQDDYPF